MSPLIIAVVLLSALALYALLPPYILKTRRHDEDLDKEEQQAAHIDDVVTTKEYIENSEVSTPYMILDKDLQSRHRIGAFYVNFETREIVAITPYIQDCTGFLAYDAELQSGNATIIDLDDLTQYKEKTWDRIPVRIIN